MSSQSKYRSQTQYTNRYAPQYQFQPSQTQFQPPKPDEPIFRKLNKEDYALMCLSLAFVLILFMFLFVYFIIKEYSNTRLIIIFSFLAGAIGAFYGYYYFYNKYLEDVRAKKTT
jgi:uncharacterized membrane protein SpoIIM required for sporulation